jgi:mannose-6-phosphate isomerase-like protein (cupin superfamily)
MTAEAAAPIIRRPEQTWPRPLAPGVTVTDLLDDRQGCRGLHQRRLRFAGPATTTDLSGVAAGQGESWYVIRGSGVLDTRMHGAVRLQPGTAVWMRGSLPYRCRARPGEDLEVLAVIVRAESPGADERPALLVTTLDECEPERTGDREFRVLLSPGLPMTQFAGRIPPGRAPAHQHTYDEVVHVLAGRGVAHLADGDVEIGPGTSIYLPPGWPHCLENTGQDLLELLGVFYPAGSPAAKQAT